MKSNNNRPYNEPTYANYTFHICGNIYRYIQKPKSEVSLPKLLIIRLDLTHNILKHACTFPYEGSLNISIN